MLKITGKHIEVTDAIREHANEQFNKVCEHIDISERSLSFGKEKHLFSVVATAETRDGFSATGTAQDKDCYKAITEAVRKLDKQLGKHRAKMKEHTHERVVELETVEDETLRQAV
jgi:putative sigma-54 modulation protein